MQVGYARVSTNEQETNMQLDALQAAGVDLVFQEKASSVGRRPQLHQALKAMRPGDVLVVWKLDRLARSLLDLLGILQRLADMGCGLRSLTEPIDTSTPMGVFVLQILGAVAQLERAMIRERSIAGQVAAYQRGTRWGGRSSSLDDEQRLEALHLLGEGWTQQRLADRYGVSRSTISRIATPPKPRPRERMPVLRNYIKACDE